MVNTQLLKAKIVETGTTQDRVARSLGMSKNTLSNKVTNKTAFYGDEIIKLCEILKITDSAEKVKIFLHEPSQ